MQLQLQLHQKCNNLITIANCNYNITAINLPLSHLSVTSVPSLRKNRALHPPQKFEMHMVLENEEHCDTEHGSAKHRTIGTPGGHLEAKKVAIIYNSNT